MKHLMIMLILLSKIINQTKIITHTDKDQFHNSQETTLIMFIISPMTLESGNMDHTVQFVEL